jgi:hypothetical protein
MFICYLLLNLFAVESATQLCLSVITQLVLNGVVFGYIESVVVSMRTTCLIIQWLVAPKTIYFSYSSVLNRKKRL